MPDDGRFTVEPYNSGPTSPGIKIEQPIHRDTNTRGFATSTYDVYTGEKRVGAGIQSSCSIM
jgi:hypothetical protein